MEEKKIFCSICCQQHTPHKSKLKNKNKPNKEDIFGKKTLMRGGKESPIIVMVHTACNTEKGKLDQAIEKYLMPSLSLWNKEGGFHDRPSKMINLKKDILSIEPNGKITMKKYIKTRAHEYLRVITRELYYYHYKEFLSPNEVSLGVVEMVDQIPFQIKTFNPYVVKSGYLSETGSNVVDFLEVSFEMNKFSTLIEVNDDIKYTYARALDNKKGVYFYYVLYGIPFMVMTKSIK